MDSQDERALMVAENVYRGGIGRTIAERFNDAYGFDDDYNYHEYLKLLPRGARLLVDYVVVSSPRFDATLAATNKLDALIANHELVTEPSRVFAGYLATNQMQVWQAVAKRSRPDAKMAAFAAEVEAWAPTTQAV